MIDYCLPYVFLLPRYTWKGSVCEGNGGHVYKHCCKKQRQAAREKTQQPEGSAAIYINYVEQFTEFLDYYSKIFRVQLRSLNKSLRLCIDVPSQGKKKST